MKKIIIVIINRSIGNAQNIVFTQPSAVNSIEMNNNQLSMSVITCDFNQNRDLEHSGLMFYALKN